MICGEIVWQCVCLIAVQTAGEFRVSQNMENTNQVYGLKALV